MTDGGHVLVPWPPRETGYMTSSGDGTERDEPRPLTAEELVELYPPPRALMERALPPVVYLQGDEGWREEPVVVHSDSAFLPEPAPPAMDVTHIFDEIWLRKLAGFGVALGVVDRRCFAGVRA